LDAQLNFLTNPLGALLFGTIGSSSNQQGMREILATHQHKEKEENMQEEEAMGKNYCNNHGRGRIWGHKECVGDGRINLLLFLDGDGQA
jgi:hypothetical protein